MLAWSWWAWADGRSARAAALTAIDRAEDAVERVKAGDFWGARRALEQASGLLDDAEDRLGGPSLLPVRWLPFTSTEVTAARKAVQAARDLAAAGIELVEFLDGDRPALIDQGRLSAPALAELTGALQAAAGHSAEARRLMESAPDARLGAVRRRVSQLDEASEALHDSLEAAVTVTNRLTDALQGGPPYRVLVLFENGAELRATGGLMGVMALIEVDGDGIVLSRAEVVHELRARDSQGDYLVVAAPGDYVERYGGFLANSTLWLNVNLSPHFPTVGEVATRLYEAVTGIEPDTVVRLDLVAIGYLLDAFSPIELAGRPLAADELATEFLIDSYRRFPDPDEQSVYLAGVVRSLFDQLLGPAVADRSRLFEALERSVSERRLAAFSGDERIEAALAGIGADGGILPGEPGDVEVVVQNFGANKIDLFTETAVHFATELDGCTVEVTTNVTLTNGTPSGMDFLPQGTVGDGGRWWVSLHLPADATVLELSVDGRTAGGSLDMEARRPVVSLLVDARRGEHTTASIRWRESVDEDEYRFRLRPQPLINPATVGFDDAPVAAATTDLTHAIALDC